MRYVLRFFKFVYLMTSIDHASVPVEPLKWHQTTSQPTPREASCLAIIFLSSQYVKYAIKGLKEYFLLNKILDTYKYALLKCSLQEDARTWFQPIAFSMLGYTPTYQIVVKKLKENFPYIQNKSCLRIIVCNNRGILKIINFLFRKLEITKLLES